ncbi:hypothetical protein IBTHAUMO2_480003 [Nitrosopumilaceae archaeon]|nr:hypothetical protein [Nitrosopumilus sp.]CAI9831929.1 hypothetical protein IBTHAUMO2_480003 [Nitrosopumilaceae archaeon]MDA7944899.1 hypothetical protein [Nitrosopumilus sp.]MDA7954491.1 hypothetical protein [Nitrosopumilus sp.]MDA7973510.1 hypothetical protein [Nitrosopumilus sp.]
MDTEQAWAVLGRLGASKVPKYTRRRNHVAVRNLLERLGEGPPLQEPPYFQRGWHALATPDGPLPEAHYRAIFGFRCDTDFAGTYSVTMKLAPGTKKCAECVAKLDEARRWESRFVPL